MFLIEFNSKGATRSLANRGGNLLSTEMSLLAPFSRSLGRLKASECAQGKRRRHPVLISSVCIQYSHYCRLLMCRQDPLRSYFEREAEDTYCRWRILRIADLLLLL